MRTRQCEATSNRPSSFLCYDALNSNSTLNNCIAGPHIIGPHCSERDGLLKLNAFTYWAYLFSGCILYSSPFLGQSPHAGWFSYTPYTSMPYSPAHGMDFYNLSLMLLTISTTGGAINFIVTILRLRAPGMSVSKMPLFLYSTLTVSLVTVFAMPALTANNIFLELERRWSMSFYEVSRGGNPLLWQHLFWFFGHPWVYIVFLPATGMVSMIIPTFSRRPIVGYPYVAISTELIGQSASEIRGGRSAIRERAFNLSCQQQGIQMHNGSLDREVSTNRNRRAAMSLPGICSASGRNTSMLVAAISPTCDHVPLFVISTLIYAASAAVADQTGCAG